MTDYGLKIFNSVGSATLDTTDKITRLRYSTEVSASVNASITLSDIAGKSTCQFGVGLESGKTPHGVTRSGTIISWTARGSANRPSSSTLVSVFLYD